MPYPPKSPPWCWRCARDEADDGVTLFPVYLSRSLVGASGRRTTRTIPTRVCADCAAIAIEAAGRSRRDLLEQSRPPAPRRRTDRGTSASRTAIADASLVAGAD